MRYADHRETIYKGLARMLDERRAEGADIPLPVATPRIIADPKGLAFTPKPNRASRRQPTRGRRFKFPVFEKPWSAA